MGPSSSVVFAGEADPEQAWASLASDPRAVLIDVRTEAEWTFVGVPDLASLGKELWLAPWKRYPAMNESEGFVPEIGARLVANRVTDAFFICRSGARSLSAAMALAADPGLGAALEKGALRLVNVKEGFEGDLDRERRRGRMNGWKARGLPWVQS